jgi:AAHS family 4-hydroxybenzoate transporter-like MFS transporter
MLKSINLSDFVDQPASSGYQIMLLILLCSFMFVEGYDMQVLSYAAPAMIKTFHASKKDFGFVFSSTLIGFVAGSFLIGSFDTIFGRRPVIIAGLLAFGVLTLTTAEAGNIPEIIFLRGLGGLGMGAAAPNAVALMADYGSTRRRTLFVCMLYLGYTGGAAAGGFIASKLIPELGWRSVFVCGGIGSMAVAAMHLLWLPESVKLMALRSQQQGKRPPDKLIATLRRLRPDLEIADDARVIVPGEKIPPGTHALHLFTNGNGLISVLLWFDGVGNNLTHYFLSSWLPTVLMISGVGMTKAILAGGVFQFMGAVGSLFIGFALDRFGPIALAFLLALGVPFVIALGHIGGSEILLLGTVAGTGFFIIGGQTGLNGVASIIYPTYLRSTGAGWSNGVGRIGGIIAPIVGGEVLSSTMPLPRVFLIAAIPLSVAAVSIFILSRLRKVREQRGDSRTVRGALTDQQSLPVEEPL